MYFSIGIYNPKRTDNVGSLYRSANIFGASYIYTIGTRISRQYSDTLKTSDSKPYFCYDSFEKFFENIPYGCKIVAVEISENAVPLETYKHPSRAIYILGSEDNGIPKKILEHCHDIIQIPLGNFNVANAGNIVMYDRYIKSNLQNLEYSNNKSNN